MAADVVQAQYETLEAIAARFGQQAEATSDLMHRVQRAADALRGGDWQGKGVDAFGTEMDQDLYPALVRLQEAMVSAQSTTLVIKEIVAQAEEEAAARFREVRPSRLHHRPRRKVAASGAA